MYGGKNSCWTDLDVTWSSVQDMVSRSKLFAVLALVALVALAAVAAEEPVAYEEGPDGEMVPVIKAVNDEDFDDSDVVVLTAANFTDAVKKNSRMLVEFYAPWCGHCKQLKPEYGAAATRLKQTHPEVVLAKFDAVAEGAEDVAKEHNIQGFPTMKWFVDGKVHPKDCQQREAAEIVKWVAKKSGPPAQHVVAQADLDEIKTQARYAVVGFFDDTDGDDFQVFTTLASHDDSYDFHYVSDKTLAKAEGVATFPAVIFYRNFDEPKVFFTEPFEAAALADAVRTHSRPRLIDMNDETAPLIFDNDLPKLLLFSKSDTAAPVEFKKASDDATMRGHFIFATVGAAADPGLGDYLGVDAESEEPQLFLFEAQENKKYRLSAKTITLAAIQELAKDFRAGKLTPYLKAAPVAEDWDDAAVKAISSSQWEDVVLDPSRDVVVEIYAPWCGHCQKLEPLYLKAAEHLDRSYSDSLVFVKMDGTANEVEGLNIGGFPTILAYKKADKATPVDLSEELQGASAKKIVKVVRDTFALVEKKREGEGEYEAAAKRFKAAVKALKGSLLPAAEELDKAAGALEKLARKTEL